MSVIAQQRPAIERLISGLDDAIGTSVKKALATPVGLRDWSLNQRPLRFAGVSRPLGTNSQTNHIVGVFVPGHSDRHQIEGPQGSLAECDAIVLVRNPTDEERAASPLSSSALRIVQALRFDHSGYGADQTTLAALPQTQEYVAC